jgi:hypothetical protein
MASIIPAVDTAVVSKAIETERWMTANIGSMGPMFGLFGLALFAGAQGCKSSQSPSLKCVKNLFIGSAAMFVAAAGIAAFVMVKYNIIRHPMPVKDDSAKV